MFLNRLRKNNILTIFFSFYFRVLSFLMLSAENSFGKPPVYVTVFCVASYYVPGYMPYIF